MAICLQCDRSFQPDTRIGDAQRTCSREACQRMRKRAKLRRWRVLHPDRAQSHPSKARAWAKAFPDYWQQYRREHPDYRAHDNERRRQARRRARRAAKETLIADISRRKLEALEALQSPDVSAKETPIDRRVEVVVDYLVWKERAAKESPMVLLPVHGG